MYFCTWAWLLWACLSGLAGDGAPADPAYPGTEVAEIQPWPWGWGADPPCAASTEIQHWESSLPPGCLSNLSCFIPTEETDICSSWGSAKQEWVEMQLELPHSPWAGLHCCSPCASGVLQGVISHLSILTQRLWGDLCTHFPSQYQGAAFSHAFTCTVDVALEQTLPVWACEQGV